MSDNVRANVIDVMCYTVHVDLFIITGAISICFLVSIDLGS